MKILKFIEENKYSQFEGVNKLNMTQKLKVNSISQNNRKKIMKQNWNTIGDVSIGENLITQIGLKLI